MEAASENLFEPGYTPVPVPVNTSFADVKLELVRPFSKTGISASKRVLVVEDDYYSAKIFKLMMKKLGYDCDFAVDGASALKMVLAKSYRLILSDINLPDCSGRQLVSQMRALCPDAGTKIVAFTAHSELLRNTFLRDGFDDYFAKPFTKETLGGLLAKTLV